MNFHNAANNGLSQAISRGMRGGSMGMGNHDRMDHALSDDELKRYAPSVFAMAAHESRSERFQPIPTFNIIQGLRAEGFMPFQAKQSRTRDESRIDFTKHLIRFRREGEGNGTYRNDKAIPEIVLVNANDGSSSYQLFGGIFRVVCLNGLIVADSMIQSVRIGHKGNILDRVIEGSYSVLQQTSKAMEVRQAWQDTTLAPREALAFAEAAHELRFPERDEHGNVQGAGKAIAPSKLLQVRRHGDEAQDLWTTFNRVQENVMRGGLHGHTRGQMVEGVWKPARNITTKPVNGIDQDVKLNKALWSLAEKMAEIKHAA